MLSGSIITQLIATEAKVKSFIKKLQPKILPSMKKNTVKLMRIPTNISVIRLMNP